MLEKLLKNKQIAAVICNQFGDTGKGKIVDYLSEWADVIARGTGGNNAGHTTVVNGVERVFHLIPAGIIYDSLGKVNILGNGMVLDISALNKELIDLDNSGISYNNLMISKDASVIMPYHIAQDCAKNKSQKNGGIGSTGRGIGPCYTDKIARRGIFIKDLFNEDILAKKINKIKEFYPGQEINTDEIIDFLIPYKDKITPFVRDTVNEMHNFVRKGKKVLLEGAQGLLLSIEHGTYPFVTSSDCSLNGAAGGVGLSAYQVDLPLGIFKGPFMTRVGGGPFVTELGGEISEKHCGDEGDIFYEVKNYLGMNLNLDEIKRLQSEKNNSASIEKLVQHRKNVNNYINSNRNKVLELINSNDEFLQGIGARLVGGEYGATTGRPRRTGWIDAVAGKYAVGINGPLMILTKPDTIADADEFKVCYGYETSHGNILDTFSKDEDYLRDVKPKYIRYKGYGEIGDVKDYSKLPQSLKKAIEDFEIFTGGQFKIISVGPERNQTIVR